jgi:2,3-bisphosphoglycerate-independent phosphoglycerate mutase
VPAEAAVVQGGALHAIKESERIVNGDRRLSHFEMEQLEKWVKTLDKDKQEQVQCLINEAREHRKLLGALHDELVNDMC